MNLSAMAQLIPAISLGGILWVIVVVALILLGLVVVMKLLRKL